MSLSPVPAPEPFDEDDVDLFGRYRFLLPITVDGTRRLVPENNTVLRALQFLELKAGCVKMPWSDYCWNDTKGCCEMSYRPTPGADSVLGRACQVQAVAGLEIVTLPKGGQAVGSQSDEESGS